MVEWYGKRAPKFCSNETCSMNYVSASLGQLMIHRHNLAPETTHGNLSAKKIKTSSRKVPASDHILSGSLLWWMDVWKWLKIIQHYIKFFPISLIFVQNFRMLYTSPWLYGKQNTCPSPSFVVCWSSFLTSQTYLDIRYVQIFGNSEKNF